MHITEKQLQLITKVASEEAIKAYKEHTQKVNKERHDKRLRNIKLLLNNYRSLLLHCEKLKDDLEELEETSIQELDIEEINLESIESIKKSKTKTIAMVYFIQGKIEAYKKTCSTSELKYFRVLEKKYITEKKYTIQEIADSEHIDRATVHRHLNKAMEELPVIFFGVDAIKFK